MSKKVFIIDDDLVYQLILKKMMTKVYPDAIIETYQNGSRALEAIAGIAAGNGEFPNVIFLDINMPVMDGWQFLEGVAQHQELNTNTRIYMISTSLDMRDKERALSHPQVKEYIYKPITTDKMKEVLEA